VDGAFSTIYGGANLTYFEVWAYQVPAAPWASATRWTCPCASTTSGRSSWTPCAEEVLVFVAGESPSVAAVNPIA